MNKVGAYWFNQKANKEISSVGDDINVRLPDLSLYFFLLLMWVIMKKFSLAPIHGFFHMLACRILIMDDTTFGGQLFSEVLEIELGSFNHWMVYFSDTNG